MKKLGFLTRIRRKLKDRKGQSTTEYILILAIVVMIATKVKTQLGGMLGNKVNSLEQSIDDFK